MRGQKRELPAFVRIGLRLRHICKCDVPTPGEYVVERIGASRKMAWARNSLGGGAAVLRANDVTRTWGERYEVAAGAAQGEEK